MKSRTFCAFALLAILGFAAPATVRAQDAVLKQRFAQRLPAVDNLKQRQVVGETNTGFLEVRGQATPDEERVVTEENADRAEAYRAIARSLETTPEAVGKARAKQIASASARGVLVQDENGRWVDRR